MTIHLILAGFATLLVGFSTGWAIHELATTVPLYWIELIDYKIL